MDLLTYAMAKKEADKKLEPFVVTFEYDEERECYVADKSIAEIYAASESKRYVITGVLYEEVYTLNLANENEAVFTNVYIDAGVVSGTNMDGVAGEEGDVWEFVTPN